MDVVFWCYPDASRLCAERKSANPRVTFRVGGIWRRIGQMPENWRRGGKSETLYSRPWKLSPGRVTPTWTLTVRFRPQNSSSGSRRHMQPGWLAVAACHWCLKARREPRAFARRCFSAVGHANGAAGNRAATIASIPEGEGTWRRRSLHAGKSRPRYECLCRTPGQGHRARHAD